MEASTATTTAATEDAGAQDKSTKEESTDKGENAQVRMVGDNYTYEYIHRGRGVLKLGISACCSFLYFQKKCPFSNSKHVGSGEGRGLQQENCYGGSFRNVGRRMERNMFQ